MKDGYYEVKGIETVHEQVKMQLNCLMSRVKYEEEEEMRCKKTNSQYIPSRRKWADQIEYEEYKNEIEKNGDKNLLVMIKLTKEDGHYRTETLPFARRRVREDRYVHRKNNGMTQILISD